MAKLGDRQHAMLFEATIGPIMWVGLTKQGLRRCERLRWLGLLKLDGSASGTGSAIYKITVAGRKALEEPHG